VNVYDFGARGDGQNDDTGAFQAALNAMGTQASGGIVFAPRGSFRFNGQITIPRGVTLEGTYRTVPSHGVAFNQQDQPNVGTVLMPYADRNNPGGNPFIQMSEDSTLRGVTIYYPDQVTNQPPQPYPWTVSMNGATNSAVLDVECLNCWNAIYAVNAARHYIARVQGQPINTGVYIDQTYDIGRVENVHFNPWYSQDKGFLKWQLTFGRAFVMARTDWEYMLNTFAFGYAIGYHFVKSDSGQCNGNFLGIGVDMAVNASIVVEAADPWGILITNGEFTSFLDPNFGTSDADPTQIVVTGSNSGSLRIVNSAFWGPSNQIAKIDGSGTVGFSDCIFNFWDADGKGRYAIQAAGSGNLLVRGCDFQKDGNQVQMQGSLRRAVIAGNVIMGRERIQDGGVGNLQKGLNAAL